MKINFQVRATNVFRNELNAADPGSRTSAITLGPVKAAAGENPQPYISETLTSLSVSAEDAEAFAVGDVVSLELVKIAPPVA